ncbi:MAG: ankyrin repeat domain-containing protein [Candidatus Schekmanbacteria bacterium]|nr:ankyrin repeat domain-containing protein [Candidatus Schekmanbacteria bacterium]
MVASKRRLVEAVVEGNLGLVRALLLEDPEVAAAKDAQGMSALLVALYHHQPAIAHLLAAELASLDLFEAAALGDAKRLDELLDEEPASACAYSSDGFTPLHLAAYFGRESCVRRLLEAEAPVHARSRNSMDVTPLHSAAAGGSGPVVALLLSAGADPNAIQPGGWTPLHAAARLGDVEVVRLLLDSGAVASARSEHGSTPRDEAVAYDRDIVIRLLDEALGED